jgi:hypothetical protein
MGHATHMKRLGHLHLPGEMLPQILRGLPPPGCGMHAEIQILGLWKEDLPRNPSALAPSICQGHRANTYRQNDGHPFPSQH